MKYCGIGFVVAVFVMLLAFGLYKMLNRDQPLEDERLDGSKNKPNRGYEPPSASVEDENKMLLQ